RGGQEESVAEAPGQKPDLAVGLALVGFEAQRQLAIALRPSRSTAPRLRRGAGRQLRAHKKWNKSKKCLEGRRSHAPLHREVSFPSDAVDLVVTSTGSQRRKEGDPLTGGTGKRGGMSLDRELGIPLDDPLVETGALPLRPQPRLVHDAIA